jgi:hypothetical protein
MAIPAPAPIQTSNVVWLGDKGTNMGQDLDALDTITIKLERQGSGAFVASSPELSGLLTQGANIGEALHNLTAAFALEEKWSKNKEAIRTKARQQAEAKRRERAEGRR